MPCGSACFAAAAFCALSAAQAREPEVRASPDRAAIREAISPESDAGDRYVSSRAISHYLAARVARESGDDAGAVSELREAAIFAAEDPYPHCALAEEYLRQGQDGAALRAVREWLDFHPEDATALTLLGRIQLQLGESDRAASALRRAAGFAPRALEPAALLVEALLANGEPAAALAAANRMVALAGAGASPANRRLVAQALDRAAQAVARSQGLTRR